MNNVRDEKVRRALTILAAKLQAYPKAAVACSFGKDSMVALHLTRRVDPHIPVFFINTRFMPKETIEFKDMIVKAWKLDFREFDNDGPVSNDLHLKDPNECCRLLKVLPAKEAVKDLDLWITGIRSTEGVTRANITEVEFRGLVKINPIASWSEADVWRYMAIHKIPVHPWYDLGYRSISCACCSAPNTEEERGGRWKGTGKCGGECGIHTCELK